MSTYEIDCHCDYDYDYDFDCNYESFVNFCNIYRKAIEQTIPIQIHEQINQFIKELLTS